MDPNEALHEIRIRVERLLDSDANPFLENREATGERLAELFQGLDTWIRMGGFLPEDWRQR
jgi:hypothetical protein